MSEAVISVEGLGKKYLIGHQAATKSYLTLREALMRKSVGLLQQTKNILLGHPIIAGETLEEIWALRGASFSVKCCEILGIIGKNGAGKSTLLKILSRITKPSAGRVAL